MDIAIIGGGAAGFFAAITAKENYPDAEVTIYEKSKKLLSKVKLSGGGRCNLTNNCASINELSAAYPRGKNALKKAFRNFDNKQTMDWFESRGVPLLIQDDNCVFPRSQSSQSIVDCLLEQAEKLNVTIELEVGVKALRQIADTLQLEFIGGMDSIKIFDKVIVATGGSPKKEGLLWLQQLNHKIEDPVPSLFTFKMPNEQITRLMGIVAENTFISILGSRFKSEGSLLITHWGMSGPAILKLSAFAARWLNEKNYRFNVQINWINQRNQEKVLDQLNDIILEHPKRLLANVRPYSLPERLWCYLLDKCNLAADRRWGEIGKSGLNKLVNVLTNDVYAVQGQTRFRDEFVTCGGVSLESIDFNTMQSMVCKNLYFAGEVLNIDGITGGYNLQAAWTTAFIAASLEKS